MDNFVSIIVPMYNSSKTIDRCLKSILNQSYKNFEVIIINDGFTDNCDEIVKNYQKSDDRIVLINQENAGVSKARNAGLDIAKGDFIQFVDSDDEIYVKYLEKMLGLIISNDLDMAVCNNEHPVFYTNFIQRNYDMTNHDEFLKFYQDTFWPTLSWNKLIKREVIGESKFKDYLKFAEDETFFCAIIGNVKKISTTSEVLLLYTKEF
jgi:glycosyltransferase involved in cell wall biosynthesis